jgi:hypothetical protein
MRIEIELDDSEFCNSCPFHQGGGTANPPLHCVLGYEIYRKDWIVLGYKEEDPNRDIPRPKECRMRNGR